MEVRPIFVPYPAYVLWEHKGWRHTLHETFLPIMADQKVIYSIGLLYFGKPSVCLCFPMNNNNSDMARSYGNIIPVLMSCISVDVSRNTMFMNCLLESPTLISKWRRLHRTSVNVSTVAWTWWMRRVGKDCSLPRLAEWRSDFSKCTPDAMRTLRLHNISCQYVAPTFPLDRK